MARGSLSFRIGAIMLAGFVLMQSLMVIALQVPGQIEDRTYNGLPSPPALAQLVASVEAAGPAGGRLLIENFNGSLFKVDISARASADFREVPLRMVPMASAYRAAIGDHNVVVDGGPGRLNAWMGDRARPIRFLMPIRVTVWLHSGEVLVLTGRPADGLRAYLIQRSLIGLAGGVLLLLLLWFALRQTTQPLKRLTGRVEAFGANLNAADARVEGSRETRLLAEAFNDMKHRIAHLVGERTLLLAGIGHDMRTYLTRLRLRADYIDDATERGRAERDLEQMGALLDDSLLFAGLRCDPKREIATVNLVALTGDLIAMRPAEEARRITVDGLSASSVRADPAGLERVFGNLVDNALRHATMVSIGIEADGDKLLWRFRDDGSGVRPEELGKLGTPFARLDPSRDRRTGGVGLGLAIVRGLVEAMGGTVAFKSPPSAGLEVTITLSSAI